MTFLGPFALCLGAVLGLYVVIDLVGNINDFMQCGGLWQILATAAEYYLYHLPLFLCQILPFVTLMSAAFAIGRLNRSNELMAMMGSGLSAVRLVWPILLAAFLIALLGGLNQNFLVPALQRHARRVYLRVNRDKAVLQDLFLPDRQGRTFFIGEFDFGSQAKVLRNVWVMEPYTDGKDVKIHARRAAWSDDGRLILVDVTRLVHVIGGEDSQRSWDSLDQLWLSTDLTPTRCLMEHSEYTMVPLTELRDMLREASQKSPAKVRRLTIELHNRIAFPIANVALLLVGIPFIFYETSSRLLGAGICLVVCVGFYLLNYVCLDLGGKSALFASCPSLSAWLATLLFAVLGIANFLSMEPS